MERLVVTASGTLPTTLSTGDVERVIGERHHGRPRNRAARAQVLGVVFHAHTARAVAEILQKQRAPAMMHFGKTSSR